MHILIFNPIVPKTACLKTQQGQNFNIPNGCKISGIKLSFCFRWQKYQCLWDAKQEDIKIAMLENLGGIISNYSQLFHIAKASPKQFFVFLFVLCFSFLTIAADASLLLIALSVEIWIKRFK